MPDNLSDHLELVAEARRLYEAQPFRDHDEVGKFRDDDEDADWTVAANINRHLGVVVLFDNIAERVPHENVAAFLASSFSLVPELCDAVDALTAEVQSLRAQLATKEHT